ncbi:hypothetical protein ACP3V5_17550 [Vibrio maritimus]
MEDKGIKGKPPMRKSNYRTLWSPVLYAMSMIGFPILADELPSHLQWKNSLPVPVVVEGVPYVEPVDKDSKSASLISHTNGRYTITDRYLIPSNVTFDSSFPDDAILFLQSNPIRITEPSTGAVIYEGIVSKITETKEACSTLNSEKCATINISSDMFGSDNAIPLPAPLSSTNVVPNPMAGRVIAIAPIGSKPNNGEQSYVIKTQQWTPLSSSYSLASGETKNLEYVHSTGISKASSSMETVTKSISASASYSGLVVSASISAALSKTNSTLNTSTFHEQTTHAVTEQMVNLDKDPKMYFHWGLQSSYLFSTYGSNCAVGFVSQLGGMSCGKVTSRIIVNESPTFVQTHNINQLLSKKATKPVKEKVEVKELTQTVFVNGLPIGIRICSPITNCENIAPLLPSTSFGGPFDPDVEMFIFEAGSGALIYEGTASELPKAKLSFIGDFTQWSGDILAKKELSDHKIIILDRELFNDGNFTLAELQPLTSNLLVPKNGVRLLTDVSPTYFSSKNIPDSGVARISNWQKATSSMSLANGQTLGMTYLRTTGITNSTTKTSSTEESVSADVSASDGFYSASVSASLSKSTSTSNTNTSNESDTTLISKSITNLKGVDMMYIDWVKVTEYVTVRKTGSDHAPYGIESSIRVNEAPEIVTEYPIKQVRCAVYKSSDECPYVAPTPKTAKSGSSK